MATDPASIPLYPMRDTPVNIERVPGPSILGSRLLGIQALRAIAALLVVWVHSIDAAQLSSAPRQINFFHWRSFGDCGVDIFFVISGFIVSRVAVRSANQHTARPFSAAGGFLSRRITRIFPLYWILTLIIVLEQQFGRHSIDWPSVYWLPTLLLLPSFPSKYHPVNAPLLPLGWTLMFEIYFYLILTAFMGWTPRAIVRNTVILLCGLVGLGMLIGIHRPLLVLWLNPIIMEFVLGCIIGWVFSYARSRTGNLTGAGVLLSILGTVLLTATIFTGYGNASEADWIMTGYYCWQRLGLWGIPSALLVAGIVLWNPAMRSLPARLLVFLGDASYSIYLCTIPSRSVVEHLWRSFGRFGADIGVLFGAMFCAAAGVVCYLLIERPLMRAFHNWYKPIPLHTT